MLGVLGLAGYTVIFIAWLFSRNVCVNVATYGSLILLILTSSGTLFSIYLTKPNPFCLMDEVDAPLDDANVGRFLRLLDEFKVQTQFLVITHNPRTMQAADSVYGVTMQEPGVSTIVGVRLVDHGAAA